MSLIDSHAHLEMPHFDDDRDEIVERARLAGVERIITVATNREDADKALDITRRYEDVFMALGVHPHDAKSASQKVFEEMIAVAADPKVVAWGEIGLDYHYDHSPRAVQREIFTEQIRIARKLDLPIIIHTREAWDDCLEILGREMNGEYRGVVHCFGGGVEEAQKVVDMGFHVSFTGTVTFKKNMPEHDVIRHVGMERILVETDCPYLTPKPHRGKRNEPALLRFTAEKIAEILDMPFDEAAEIAAANTRRLFGKLR